MSANIELLEAFDSHAALRNGLRQVAEEQGYWAGIPMPLGPDNPLVVEPRYPRAKEITEHFGPEAFEELEEGPPIKQRNEFYSTRYRCRVLVAEVDGKIRHCIVPAVHSLTQQLHTVGASVAWGIEQEAAAIQTLASLLRHHNFRQYLLTGAFLEKSERSGVMYLFRRLRPTVAMKEIRGKMQVLCALCLHPIAYYGNSWAGAMCPTDDVIAHLMLMRGDEPMFWRRANQHPAYRPEAGL